MGNTLQNPNLDRMWETFVRIPSENGQVRFKDIFDIIRFKISPMVQRLKNDGTIDWYCFLIHGRNNGVPTSQDDNSPYFHIRMTLKGNGKADFPKSLPEYCVMTRKIDRTWVEQISLTKDEVFDVSLFRNEGIEEVWRIIGEQSEWLLNTLDAYKENASIPPLHIAEFLHYYSNMTQMRLG